jgi:hypothetical protein
MQQYTSLEQAREAEQQRGYPFVEIRRISDTEWDAYETQAEVPPEPQSP